MQHNASNLSIAIKATTHCLIGCSMGEILGMVLTTALNLNNFLNISISIILAFVFGYLLSLIPLIKHGMSLKHSLTIAIASDTASITSMEFMDNLILVAIPAAINATLEDALFWESLIMSLVVAFLFTIPINYFLIQKGRGHATHSHHI